jgi:hypothetical protein
MAEGVGFEPTVRLHVQQFSRLSQSATLAPLRRDPGNPGRLTRAEPNEVNQSSQARLDLIHS